MLIDLHSATTEIAALETIFPKLTKRFNIIFDDFDWYVFKTQPIEEKTWAKKFSLDILALSAGPAVIVKVASAF